MPRVKQRTPELREKVLRAAMDTLVADGVSGFTTRRVVRAASTSTPAVYELFGDRAGLVREMFLAPSASWDSGSISWLRRTTRGET